MKKHQLVSRQKLYEILCETSRAGQWVTITTVTIPDMIGPWKGLFRKVATIRVKLKCKYSNCVNLEREREGKPTNFVAGLLPWGEWDENAPPNLFIRLKDKLYLRVHVHRVVQRYFCTHTGEPVSEVKVKPLLRKRRYREKRQGVEKPVACRTYELDTIRRISVGGQRLERQKKFAVEV